ncbi:hypothetical protein LEL_10538 [Akanthomyces lecanii RCEF 1005]|uniref:Protein kinase-like domain protein n=1 Tax=Akanthomyces lecanii RCEF 1005 TaxID=1081108 RepID=A0A167XKL2_CORDF|nr:hypothetical protein LEL_10538 [Akanthomyces lecanii RCEF 1005]
MPSIRPSKLKPDGGGIRTGLDGRESVAFVYDYKAAHKFSIKHLEAALAKETLFVDVHEWVLCEQYGRDPELRGPEQEEARIAMALIQVFNYMLFFGTPFGFLGAGKFRVELFYEPAEPLVLRWRLCIPNIAEAQRTTEVQISQLYQTAVSQLASFCLLSLRSTTLTGLSLEEALHQAHLHLRIWKETRYKDPTTPPEPDGKAPLALPSPGTDKTYLSDGSPSTNIYTLRSSRLRRSCNDATVPSQPRDDDDGSDGPRRGGEESPRWQTETGASFNRRSQGSNRKTVSGSENSSSAFTKQYCTQACLLGLKFGRQLDRRCPNVHLHDVEGNDRHPLDALEFTQLMTKELHEDVYKACFALDGWGKYGATGVLFKLEMALFGYTFVGKGTTSWKCSHLTHEGKIYQKLSKLQGYIVPVHLGMVSLDPGYVLPGGARVTHMMLMSWAGREMSSEWELEVNRSMQTIRENGVLHQDERADNMLWNAERCRVMVVDFHLAMLIPECKGDSRSRLKRKGDGFETDDGKKSLLRGPLQSVR